MYRVATFFSSYAAYGIADFIIQPSGPLVSGEGALIENLNYALKYNLSSGVGAFSILCCGLAASSLALNYVQKDTSLQDVYFDNDPDPKKVEKFNNYTTGVAVLGTTALVGKEFFDATKPNQQFDTVDTALVFLAGAAFCKINKARSKKPELAHSI